jgi:hypothetical protein
MADHADNLAQVGDEGQHLHGELPLPTNDAGEAIKHPSFSAKMARADALVASRQSTTMDTRVF